MVTPLTMTKKNEKKFKKVIIIFLVFLLLISNTFIMPKQKVEAFAWAGAIPAGITFAGGAYAVTALAVGGTLAKFGIEHGEAIQESAHKVWGSATDLAKESINTSIDIAKATGEKVVEIGSGFWDWVTDTSASIVGLANTVGEGLTIQQETPLQDKEVEIEVDGAPVTIITQTAFPEAIIAEGGNNAAQFKSISAKFPKENEIVWAVTTEKGLALYDRLSIQIEKKSQGAEAYLSISARDVLTDTGSFRLYDIAEDWVNLTGLSSSTYTYDMTNSIHSDYVNNLIAMMNNARTVEDVLGLAGHLGLDNINVGTHATYENYINNRVKVLTQDIPAMRDAGLVLPVDNALPYEAGNPANQLEFDETTGEYVGADGKIYTGQIDWTIPQVRVVTGVDGLPYVVTHTRDGTIIDVKTGEGVTTTDNPFNPPGGGGGEDLPKTFNLRPLVMLGEDLKEKFPFSIPWDVFKLFSVLNVEPITPKFAFNTDQGISIGGRSILVDYDFDIDFSIFDPIAQIIRWGIILVFDISIVLALRRLTPD